MRTYLIKLYQIIDNFTEFFGKLLSWLVIVLVFLVGYDVFMRYFFQSGSVGLQELEWYLFSTIFLLGGGYTLKHDDHVRMDVLYRSRFFNDKHRAWLDVIGSIVILIPFCFLIVISAEPFVTFAFLRSEVSPDPGGLPFRWLIKFMIPFGFTLLIIQGIADAMKKLLIAIGDAK